MGIIKIERGYYNNGLRDEIDEMNLAPTGPAELAQPHNDCRLVGYETIDGIEYEVFYTYEDAWQWAKENKQRLHKEFMEWIAE